jgi:hypothetical protein
VSMNTSGASGTNASGKFDISNSGDKRGIGGQQADKAENPGSARMTPTSGKAGSMSQEPGAQGVDTESIVIEVLTQESGTGLETKLGGYPYFAPEVKSSGFQWWYVPAIAVPIAAAAGATVTALIMRRRRQEMRAAQLAAAAAAARNWVDILRLRGAVDQVNALLQQSKRWGRQSSQLTPQQLNVWRDLLNQQVNQWRTQVPGQVNAWRDLATQQANQWRDTARGTAQPVVDAARSRALASRANATQAFSGASQSVNASVSHTLAFGLGAMVSAMLTYVGLSRQRTANAELEATHSRTDTMREEPIL